MRNAKLSDNHEKSERKGNPSIHGFVSLSVCAVTVITLSLGVYAASDSEAVSASVSSVDYDLPTGIAGVASGVSSAPEVGSEIYRIGTSCEHVVVGQRVQEVQSGVQELNVSESMAAAVDDFDSQAISLASSATMMSDTDYENLLKIVEAEAGTEDIKGRVLIANVIMNRVKHPEFPDNITDVIWEYDNGVPQFSPVADGRINEVTISDETKEAVRLAMEGVDYSEGALFFIQKSAAEKHNIAWFERDLKRLFKHGVHEFYTYPEETSESGKASEEDAQDSSGEDAQLVQMIKTDTSQVS